MHTPSIPPLLPLKSTDTQRNLDATYPLVVTGDADIVQHQQRQVLLGAAPPASPQEVDWPNTRRPFRPSSSRRVGRIPDNRLASRRAKASEASAVSTMATTSLQYGRPWLGRLGDDGLALAGRTVDDGDAVADGEGQECVEVSRREEKRQDTQRILLSHELKQILRALAE